MKRSIAYYHLPGLFEFYELYKVFLPLFREHREYFYDWCDIGSVYGAPADCIWGGGRAGFGDDDAKKVFILYNLIMQTISAFMAFTQAMIITNGGPNNSTMLYALYVYNQAFKYNDMGYACAMSWFMLVVMGLITFIIFKTSKFWVFSEAN